MPELNTNGWGEWGKHVLLELDRLDGQTQEILKMYREILIEVTTLKVKVTLFSVVASIVVTSIISALIGYFLKRG
jgi:hypothetical protein